MVENKQANQGVSIWWLVGAVVLVAALWLGNWLLLHKVTDRGTFGDMFGAVNALFSGLAFASVVFAIVLQREDLKIQMKDLALTQKILEEQRQEMQAQARALQRQNFESTFFQLLRLQNEIVNMMRVPDPMNPTNKTYEGRECFGFFHAYLATQWSKHGGAMEGALERVYGLLYGRYQAHLGHYFRSLYNIVKLVDASNVENKSLYTNLVRAQISSDEQVILFYNGLTEGREKFKPLIEKYALLKTVPKDELLMLDHLRLYLGRAYGKDAGAI